MALPKLKTQGLGTGSVINPNAKVVSFHKKADCLIYWAIKQSCFIQDSYLSEVFIYKFFDDDQESSSSSMQASSFSSKNSSTTYMY